ncbi:MAG: sigma-54-dependent transcriptional regulator [Bradymonadia bacterium]
MSPRVLVIDDGEAYAELVEHRMSEFTLLDPSGFNGEHPAKCLPDGPSALAFLEARAAEVDVALLDLHFDVPEDRLLPLAEGVSLRRTRRFQGLAILKAIRARYPSLPVVLLTALEDVSLSGLGDDLAGQSMTYFLDGEDLDALRIRIHSALQEAAQGLEESGLLWGRDPAMAQLRRRLSVLARGRLPIIVEGETGTGKSFLAERFVHANSGRSGPFVTVDLSTIPRDLIPAHLFGALRGAYTGAVTDRKGVFELAHGGTLFIDEIQNIPLEVQKQLLWVLQEGRVRPLGASKERVVDVKVVVASNAPLAQAVAEGKFRPDLYMRLSPATRVLLPPLRARRADLLFLAQRFVAQAAEAADNIELKAVVARSAGLPADAPMALVVRKKGGKGAGAAGRALDQSLLLSIPDPAWRRLAAHRWPGNVRELAMVMHNLVTFTLVAAVDAVHGGVTLESRRLQVDSTLVSELIAAAEVLAPSAGAEQASTGDPNAFGVTLAPADTLNGVSNAVERQYLTALFHQTDGDFAQMAHRLLGDSEKGRAVRLRFNQLGLKVRELRSR